MQTHLKVFAPVMLRDVDLPNSSKKERMIMVPVPDSKTLMAIPMSAVNNLPEEEAKDILHWEDGIGRLEGCDLKFKINQLGCLELVDSDDDGVKHITPGSSLLRGGPARKRARVITKRPEANQESIILDKLLPQQRLEKLKADVLNWSVEDVEKFIMSIPGCRAEGHLFWSHQICGKSLLHLEQKDLVEILKVRLGPAVKIYNAINLLKSDPRSQ